MKCNGGMGPDESIFLRNCIFKELNLSYSRNHKICRYIRFDKVEKVNINLFLGNAAPLLHNNILFNVYM